MINLYNRFRIIREHVNSSTFAPNISIFDSITGITHIIQYNYVDKTKTINNFLLKVIESTRDDKLKYLIDKYDNTDSGSE